MALKLVPLEMRTLPKVRGGVVELMFNKAIARAIQDVCAAPDIKDARTVDLQVKVSPVLDQGELVDMNVEFAVKGKVPTRGQVTANRHASRSRAPTGGTQLLFNLDSPDDPDQHSLFEDEDSGETR